MGLQGVNRVMIAVHDLEAAKQRYRDLLSANFEDAHWTGEAFGIAVSIAWDAGIELCAPLPGREKDSAVSAFLQHRGEGVMNVFFAVEDVSSAAQRATALGIQTVHALNYTRDEIAAHLGGQFTRYEECFLNTFEELGLSVSLVDIRR